MVRLTPKNSVIRADYPSIYPCLNTLTKVITMMTIVSLDTFKQGLTGGSCNVLITLSNDNCYNTVHLLTQ